MKRLIYALFLSLFLFGSKVIYSQQMTYSFMPFGAASQSLCFNSSTTNSVVAAIQSTGAAVVTGYSWTIVSPTCGTGTFVNSVPNGSIIQITFPCCGVYTITAYAYAGSIPIGGAFGEWTEQFTAFCPTSATIVPSSASNTVCSANDLSLTANGLTTFIWTSSAGGGGTTTAGVNPLVVTPSANCIYTVNGFNASGCAVSNTINLFVQSATMTAGPASQTLCVGSPLCFTSSGGAQTGTNVTAGTVTTGIQWFNPSGLAVAQCTSPAAQGIYTAVLTHTGAAGTCTLQQTAQVFTTNTIPVTLTASSPSICPGGTVQLFSSSQQTSAINNHTWTASSGPPIVSSGSTILQTIANPSRDYTVDVNYFGCPGQATITIGLLTLTPTLTPSAPNVCPNTSLTLTASGGVDYTITAIDISVNSTVILNTPGINTAVHTPTSPGFPWQYVVDAYSVGCVGSNTISVGILTLTPIMTSSAFNNSVCPSTTFALNSTGGAGSSFTFVAPPSTTLQSGPVGSTSHSTSVLPSTYTVHVDSAGCQGSALLTINELSLFPTVALSSPSVCEGTSFNFTSSGGANTTFTFYAPTYTTPITGTVVPKANDLVPTATHSPVFNPTVVTTYTVLVDSVGCKGSNTFSVGVLDLSPNLNLSILSGTASVYNACPSSPLTLSATAGLVSTNFTYTFTTPSTGTNSTNNVNTFGILAPGAASLFPATYTVQADSAGCAGTATINLALRVLNPGLTANTASVCAGTSVQICANPGNGSTVYNFIAASLSQTLTPPGTTVNCYVFNPTEPTAYFVAVDSANCTNLAAPIQSVLVGMNSTLTIGAQASPSIICSGLPSTLSVIGSTAYTYTWTAPSGSIISTNTAVAVNPTVSSTYTVNALDAGGCVGHQTVILTVDPTASLNMAVSAPFNTICSQSFGLPQQSNTLTASGAVNYSWSPPNFLSNTTNSITITSASTTIVYTVSGNNGLGCNGAAQFTMYVNTYPNMTTPATSSFVCPGFNSTITAFGAQSYTWTGTSFTGSVAQPSISVGPGTYTVLGSNGGSCLNTTAITIGTMAPLSINLSYANNTQTTCLIQNSPKLSKPVTLNATGASNYVWQPYDPLVMTYSLGPTTDVLPHTGTCYTVTGSTAVCSGTAVICVTVVPQFTIGATPPFPAMCLGDSLRLDVVNIGPGAVGSPAAFTYSWSEAQNAPPISMSAYLSPTTMVFPQNTTTYSIEVKDTRSCVSMPRLITVTVLPRPKPYVSLPIINNVPTNTVCFVGLSPGPSDVILNLTALDANPGLPFGIQSTYTWTSPNNSLLSGINDNPATVRAVSRTPSIVVYTVVAGYKGVNGCREVDTVSVRIVDCRPVTVVSFTTADVNDTICTRDCITFMNLTDTLAGGPQTFTWSFAGGNPSESTEANPTVCYNIPGEYNVILRVQNPYPISTGGSSGIRGITRYIKVVDYPNVTIVPPGQSASSQTISFGGSAVLTASNAFTYSWDPPYNISSLTSPVVTVSPLQTTMYVLTGKNSSKCFSYDTVYVYVEKDCGDMFVPNAFSPNGIGDSRNEELKVMGICLESMVFMVFNRWGEKVFETNDQSKGWDGTYKGKEVESGVYVYRLEGKTFDGKGYSAKGNVTLIR